MADPTDKGSKIWLRGDHKIRTFLFSLSPLYNHDDNSTMLLRGTTFAGKFNWYKPKNEAQGLENQYVN
jgi:hypothetical protein